MVRVAMVVRRTVMRAVVSVGGKRSSGGARRGFVYSKMMEGYALGSRGSGQSSIGVGKIRRCGEVMFMWVNGAANAQLGKGSYGMRLDTNI
jgi:hypothetical protein